MVPSYSVNILPVVLEPSNQFIPPRGFRDVSYPIPSLNSSAEESPELICNFAAGAVVPTPTKPAPVTFNMLSKPYRPNVKKLLFDPLVPE